jgi:asparagine synthase (glutamine-hydrolysing)
MCGIAGFIGGAEISEKQIDATLALMNRRGPNCQDVRVFRDQGTTVVLLHSRLSIIDLTDSANQPFECSGSTLIFNGEIYNYLELKRELERAGHVFRTTSDTEVLLHSYLEYGESCVERFEGMWAFAIYDSIKRRVLFSRDRFAEKPFYYLVVNDGVFFGSEIKFIGSLLGRKIAVNQRQICRYLVNGYKSLYKSGETFFEGVKELPFASNLLLDLQAKQFPKPYAYWKPECEIQPMTVVEACQGFQKRLYKSLELRLRADVPIAFCLSGGVDSSALAAVAAKVFGQKIMTFSIVDDDPRYHELDNIEENIKDLNCDNEIVRIPKDRFWERLETLIDYHDAPVATLSYYIHSLLSEAINKAGYRVVISGTAADELVTGYYDHYIWQLLALQGSSEFETCMAAWQKYIQPNVRNPFLRDPAHILSNPDFRDHIYLNKEEFGSYLQLGFDEDFSEVYFCEPVLRNRMLNELFYEITPVILHEDDLNSMYYSIENRSPYLDRNLFDFSCSIPPEHLIVDGYNKYPLRQAVKGVLNEKVRLDRQKKGFNAAILSLFDATKESNRKKVLDDSPIYDLVDREYIGALLEREEFPNSFSKYLFYFLNAKLFLELHEH